MTEPTVVELSPAVTQSPETRDLVAVDLPQDQNPALVYLAGLRPSGRRGMAGQLKKAAGILSSGALDAERFPWAEVRYQHLTALRTVLQGQGLSGASVNTCLAAVSGTLREAWKLGLMSAEDYHRARAVERVKEQRLPAGRALKLEELQRLSRTARNPQQIAILGVLFNGGLRRAELVGLDLADWNPEEGTLRVAGKGGKERLVPLKNEAREAVDDWLAMRGDEPGPLFVAVDRQGRLGEMRRLSTTAVYSLLRRLADAAGISRVSPHDARRTYVSTLLDNGADAITVSKMAGHSSVDITRRYDRRDERAAHDAAALLHFPR